jgi:hypothetical protein
VRLSFLVAVLALVLAGAYQWVNQALAGRYVREQLTALQVNELVDFEGLVTQAPHYAAIQGATLRDPASRRVVAHVERLELELDVPWSDPTATRMTRLHGQGGRVLLRHEHDGLGIVRAISSLLDELTRLLPSSEQDESAQVPILEFDDLELVVFNDGFPLERYPGSHVRITTGVEGVEVLVDAGPPGGQLIMHFGSNGLTGFETRRLRLSPTISWLTEGGRDLLEQGLSAEGLLDLVVSFDDLGNATGSEGTLWEATVETSHVPFVLGPATIPFEESDDVLVVNNAQLGFDGGSVDVSITVGEDDSHLTLDVVNAEFHERILALIPGYEQLEGVSCSGGGSFETHLELSWGDDPEDVRIVGSGGFHIEHAEITPPGLKFEDVVGGFNVNERTLSIPEASARCYGGGVRLEGSVGFREDDYNLSLAIEDIDVKQLHRDIRQLRRMKHEVGGWLQGNVRARGRVGDPSSTVADGQVSVRAGNLWKTPLLEAVLLAMPLVTRDPDARQSLEAGFEIRGETVLVESLQIRSEVLSLAGRGTIGFNGRVDANLVPLTMSTGVLGDIVNAVTQGLIMNLVVTGTLRDPRILAMPVSVLSNPIRKLVESLAAEPEDG